MSSDGGLVESEGVNAASADSTAETPTPPEAQRPAADVVSGGAPGGSPDRGDPAPGAPLEDELAGTAAAFVDEPSQEHGSSGQDSGSMDTPG